MVWTNAPHWHTFGLMKGLNVISVLNQFDIAKFYRIKALEQVHNFSAQTIDFQGLPAALVSCQNQQFAAGSFRPLSQTHC